MGEQGGTAVAAAAKSLVSRRTVGLGMVWSAPVIMAAFAAPAAAASTPVQGRSAGFATLVAQKGQKVGTNREVSFLLSFANITGSNDVTITGVTGAAWAVLPTASVTVDPLQTTAAFVLTRPDNNSTTDVTVTYTINGVTQTPVPTTILNPNQL
jgi:hypothetical protein